MPKPALSTYEACAIIEGFDGEAHSHEEVIEALQSLIDSGVVWTLQGSYGRMADAMIEDGACHFAPEAF